MWKKNDFNKWINEGRPINENIIELNIFQSDIKKLGNLENLVNLQYLDCSNNQLISLEGMVNLVNLRALNCCNNQLTSLEGIETLIGLIKINKIESYNISVNFVDSDDYVKLTYLFDDLLKYKNNDKFDEIKKMIIELNGFQNYVLK
jgi:Leucine-rich repeat (LRR) protein